jgi:hypothetical protein
MEILREKDDFGRYDIALIIVSIGCAGNAALQTDGKRLT